MSCPPLESPGVSQSTTGETTSAETVWTVLRCASGYRSWRVLTGLVGSRCACQHLAGKPASAGSRHNAAYGKALHIEADGIVEEAAHARASQWSDLEAVLPRSEGAVHQGQADGRRRIGHVLLRARAVPVPGLSRYAGAARALNTTSC